MTTINQANSEIYDYNLRQRVPHTYTVGDLVLCTRSGFHVIEDFVERTIGRGAGERTEVIALLKQVVNKHGKKVKRAKTMQHSVHGMLPYTLDQARDVYTRELQEANEKFTNLQDFLIR